MASLRASQERYARHYLALAERAEPHLTGPDQDSWLGRLEVEHDNLRAVLRWAREGGERETGLQLAGAVWRFWAGRGYLGEGRSWLEGLLRHGRAPETSDGAASVRAKALGAAGDLAYRQSDYAPAKLLHEEGLALYRELGDTRGIATSLYRLGLVLQEQGDYARATALHEESLVRFRELGDTQGLHFSLQNLGNVAYDQGDHARAQVLHEESLALARELGDMRGIAISLNNLGSVAREQGDYARATALHEESLALRRELGDRRGIAYCLEGLAAATAAGGHPERAARLFGVAAALRAAIGAPLPPNERVDYDRAVATARAALGDAAFDAAWADGQGMTLGQAMALALGE